MQNDAGSIQHELPSAVNKHVVYIDEELAHYTENKYRRSSHTRYPIVFLLVVSGFLLCLTTRDHSRYPWLSKLSPWWSTSKTSQVTTVFPSLPHMMEGASEFDWETVSRPIYLSFWLVLLRPISKLVPTKWLNWTDCYEILNTKFQCTRLTVHLTCSCW